MPYDYCHAMAQGAKASPLYYNSVQPLPWLFGKRRRENIQDRVFAMRGCR